MVSRGYTWEGRQIKRFVKDGRNEKVRQEHRSVILWLYHSEREEIFYSCFLTALIILLRLISLAPCRLRLSKQPIRASHPSLWLSCECGSQYSCSYNYRSADEIVTEDRLSNIQYYVLHLTLISFPSQSPLERSAFLKLAITWTIFERTLYNVQTFWFSKIFFFFFKEMITFYSARIH